jgi:hypothetical protein
VQFVHALFGDGEMPGAGHPIEQVQVIGQHADGEQALGQRAEVVEPVIDAGQQHRLVEQGDAGAAQRGERGRHLVVEFLRVVGMDHQARRRRQSPSSRSSAA